MSEWLGNRNRPNNNIRQLLQDLDAPAYKITSFELVDLPLIKRAAECGKSLLDVTDLTRMIDPIEISSFAAKSLRSRIIVSATQY